MKEFILITTAVILVGAVIYLGYMIQKRLKMLNVIEGGILSIGLNIIDIKGELISFNKVRESLKTLEKDVKSDLVLFYDQLTHLNNLSTGLLNEYNDVLKTITQNMEDNSLSVKERVEIMGELNSLENDYKEFRTTVEEMANVVEKEYSDMFKKVLG